MNVFTGTFSCMSTSSGVRTDERRRGKEKSGSITVSVPSLAPGCTLNVPRVPRITNDGPRSSGRTPPLNSMSADIMPRVLRFTCAQSSASPRDATRLSSLHIWIGGSGRSLSVWSIRSVIA